MAETLERIRSIIVNLLGVKPEEVTPDARFREDLGADSLDLVEMIMEFEDTFGGRISDEEAQQITTVGQAVEYVEQRMKVAEEEAEPEEAPEAVAEEEAQPEEAPEAVAEEEAEPEEAAEPSE